MIMWLGEGLYLIMSEPYSLILDRKHDDVINKWLAVFVTFGYVENLPDGD